MKYLLLIVFGLSLQLGVAQDKPIKNLDSILNTMPKSEGLLTTYFDGDKLYLEFSKEALEKDLLMVTRLKQLPSNYSAYRNAGSKTSEQLIHLVKVGKSIDLIQVSTTNVADEDDPIQLSVAQNNLNPILVTFPIKSEEGENIVIEASSFFNSDSPSFNIIPDGLKKDYKIGKADDKRSRINSAKSFPQNTEITHTLTFPTDNPPRGNSTNTFTFQVNHSIIALPEDLMQVRYEDPRVGWFGLRKYNYSSDALKSDEVRLIRRWRLEPKNKKAYARGKLTEPVKPIVYYLDPATPEKWRPYFIKGIEDWNSAFEKAGFKNAIQAKIAPTAEENPDFSPEDVRFSTVRYVASTTRNAVGPSVSDPRTGEIIESDIIWYHNHLKSYRNRYLLETGAANPKARTLDTPEEEIGEMMRRVISHEIGHALGLPHNMKASSAYPVDSLRSGSFTQENGIATTIMDYARYNYIAQPGDENIRFVRQLGPYDDYAIEWGYRYFPNSSAEEDQKILKSFVDERSTDPMYMFGGRGNDPDAQTEDIGDNSVQASTYGLSNLRIVAENLEQWTTTSGQSYEDLEELYGEMLGVYRRYIYHVASVVGGVHETLLTKGQPGEPYQVVNKAEQEKALEFLNENVWTPQYWLIENALVSKFSKSGKLKSVISLNKRMLNRLMDADRLNLMWDTNSSLIGNGLSPQELLDRLAGDLVYGRTTPDQVERELQKYFAHQLKELMSDDGLALELKGKSLALQNELKSYVKTKKESENETLNAHYAYILNVLEEENKGSK
ncbi:zinc-dependent metallopeptidase [Psychroflexus torquis ATCC 700755]|uniref:Zinc-dependent metallopeptidase n=1 Tax=Psychroflexus torquis (strain ATCC 700755 / CIP 106069 / ACAM 623) TaxID=313595 RepID=K4IHJ3_PSYTT|nr:zinc-dependent metalloprotease [Psychroflexus torquis]AFU68516.1 zinc-dependent metallopeptidase [Psychroflexus torquis ATCC 700755]